MGDRGREEIIEVLVRYDRYYEYGCVHVEPLEELGRALVPGKNREELLEFLRRCTVNSLVRALQLYYHLLPSKEHYAFLRDLSPALERAGIRVRILDAGHVNDYPSF